MIQIRPYTLQDKVKCEAIERESGQCLDAWMTQGHEFFVIEDQKQITGFASYKIINEEQASIEWMYVRIEDRGYKLGDGLLRAVLNHLNRLGLKNVYIHSNEEMHGFFLKEGLKVHYNEPGEGKILFVAVLPDFFSGPCKNHQ